MTPYKRHSSQPGRRDANGRPEFSQRRIFFNVVKRASFGTEPPERWCDPTEPSILLRDDGVTSPRIQSDGDPGCRRKDEWDHSDLSYGDTEVTGSADCIRKGVVCKSLSLRPLLIDRCLDWKRCFLEALSYRMLEVKERRPRRSGTWKNLTSLKGP